MSSVKFFSATITSCFCDPNVKKTVSLAVIVVPCLPILQFSNALWCHVFFCVIVWCVVPSFSSLFFCIVVDRCPTAASYLSWCQDTRSHWNPGWSFSALLEIQFCLRRGFRRSTSWPLASFCLSCCAAKENFENHSFHSLYSLTCLCCFVYAKRAEPVVSNLVAICRLVKRLASYVAY